MEEIRLTRWYGKYPTIYMVLAPSQVVVWDFFHQQYNFHQLESCLWRTSTCKTSTTPLSRRKRKNSYCPLIYWLFSRNPCNGLFLMPTRLDSIVPYIQQLNKYIYIYKYKQCCFIAHLCQPQGTFGFGSWLHVKSPTSHWNLLPKAHKHP